MGKIYSNHLHFLSYLLKCPVENGISKPLNLKIFWGSMPPDTPTLERLRPSNFFFVCAHLQNLTLRPRNLYEFRKLTSHDSFRRRFFKWAIMSIINLELLWFRHKQGTSWNAPYYFEHVCSSKSSIAPVSSWIEFLNANGPASFR